jgi:sarcosine oxidase
METYGVPMDELNGRDAARRFPAARFAPGEIGLFEPDAGIVFPELGIAAHQNAALLDGAELRGGVAVAGWRRKSAGAIQVELGDGDILEASHLILCAGPWLAELSRDLGLPLRVQRNVQIWFAPATRGFARGEFPAFFLDRAGLPKPLYGFPDLGAGFKAALHGYGAFTQADALDRTIHPADIGAVKDALDDWLPGAAGTFRSGKACMYALTPDEHFIIDRHPDDDGIIIAGGFSGHGYKFCPVVGEIIADLVDGVTRRDVEFLALRRFSTS